MSKELIAKIEKTLHAKASDNWEAKVKSVDHELRSIFKWNGTSYEENVLLNDICSALGKYKTRFLRSEYERLEKELFSELGHLKTLIRAASGRPTARGGDKR